MTVPGGTPERQSLYAEPYRGEGWQAPPPRRSSKLWVIPVALAGVALAALGVVLGLAAGRAHGTSKVEATDPSGTKVNAFQVGVGTCVDRLPKDGDVARVSIVPCDTRHEAEVVATYPVAGDTWPGRDVVVSEVLAHCGSVIQPGEAGSGMFQASDWGSGLRWVAWVPTEESWNIGQHDGVCVAYRVGGIRGSFVGMDATFVG